MVRQRLGCWVVIAVLAAGCATPEINQPTASDETDVWFAQHMVPHLLQTTAIVDLAHDRITRPELARLADTMDRQEQAISPSSKAGWPTAGSPPTTPSRIPPSARRPTSPGWPGFGDPSST
jgi:uncharacterized protein (DUF305 family)